MATGKKYIYFFGSGKADGNGAMKDLLGGKGAGLAEMTNAGVPVPPGFLWCGPRFVGVPLSDGQSEWQFPGTSAAYVLLHSPPDIASRLTITADPGAELQVTLVKLPAELGRLELQVDAKRRLLLTAHDSDLTLTGVSCEPLVPRATSDSSNRAREEAETLIRGWFGDPHLKGGETRTSNPIILPDDREAWVVKVAGTDAAGHAVVGWARVEAGKR